VAASGRDRSTERQFPPIAWIAYLIAYFVVVEVALLPLDLILSFNAIAILVLPALEEALKFYITRRHKEYAFYGIVLFGLMELALVKGPLLIDAPHSELPLLAAFALLAFLFHFSSASAYANSGERSNLVPVFGVCLALHIAFNATDLAVFDVPWLLTISGMLALAPIGVGRLIFRHTRPKPARDLPGDDRGDQTGLGGPHRRRE